MGRNRRSLLAVGAVGLVLGLGGRLWAGPPGESPAERRERIENMSPAEKAELLRQKERFDGLDAAEQERLVELHRQIEAHPESDKLRGVMERYYQWLQTLRPYERDELRRLPPEERIARIKELRQHQGKRREWPPFSGIPWGDRSKRPFPLLVGEKDREGLARWFEGGMKQSAAGFLEAISESHRQRFRQELERAKDDPDRSSEVFAAVWLRWQLENPKEPPPLDEPALQRLRSELSEETGAWLEKLDPDVQRRVVAHMVVTWIVRRYAFRRSGPPPWVFDRRDLREDDRGQVTREELDRLANRPREQARVFVWGRYLLSKVPDLPSEVAEELHERFRRPGPFGPGRKPPPGFHRGPEGGPPRQGPASRDRPPDMPGKPPPDRSGASTADDP